MPTKLITPKAVEGSTFIIRAEFFEATPGGQTPLVPKAGLNWSLRDKNKNIINGRNGVVINPASSVDIVLSGADLASAGNHSTERFLTVKGTYDGVGGNDLPIVDEVEFHVTNLLGEP